MLHPVVSVRDCSLLSRLLRSPRLARSRRYTRYVLVLLPRPSILDPRPRTPRFDLVRPEPTRPDRAARSRARATLTTWCTQARLFSSLLSLRLHVRTRGSNVLTLLLSEGGRGRMIPLCATRRSLFPSLRRSPRLFFPFYLRVISTSSWVTSVARTRFASYLASFERVVGCVSECDGRRHPADRGVARMQRG